MKTEQEIVLQKKIFIIFSMILIVLIMGMLNVHKAKTMDADNEINKIFKDNLTTNLKEFTNKQIEIKNIIRGL